MTRGNLRIQFVSDALVQQIIEGRKTASVVELGELLFQDLAQTQATVTVAIPRWGRFYWAAAIKYGSVVITDQFGGVR